MRYPAPDVSRGFMLLLVAVANVPAWTGADGRLTQGGLQALSATFSTADSVWIFIRTLLVDERRHSAVRHALRLRSGHHDQPAHQNRHADISANAAGHRGGARPTPAELAWAREQATVDARRWCAVAAGG